MGKKREKGKTGSRKINVEIAPGNQQAMERYIESYNHKLDRKTPKIKYTDVVNEALDKLLSARRPAPRGAARAGERK
ncbi:MAG: hypothetical protein ACLQDL_14310 [Spirochaetia bacterium]